MKNIKLDLWIKKWLQRLHQDALFLYLGYHIVIYNDDWTRSL